MQRRLQEEARVALALARPMARMQVEVERQIQLHRRSPVADLVSHRETEIFTPSSIKKGILGNDNETSIRYGEKQIENRMTDCKLLLQQHNTMQITQPTTKRNPLILVYNRAEH